MNSKYLVLGKVTGLSTVYAVLGAWDILLLLI